MLPAFSGGLPAIPSPMVNICGVDIAPLEWNGKRVITFAMVDQIHKRKPGTARYNFNYQRERFLPDRHVFVVNSNEAKSLGITAPSGLVLLTEYGYLLLATTFQDDLSYQIREMLIECYFRVQSQQGMSPTSIVLDFSDLRSVQKSFSALLDRAIALEGERDAYKSEAIEARPSVEFCKTALQSNADMLVSDFGRVLKPKHPELGPNLIFKRMKKEGYIFKRNGKWRPVVDYIESGLFHVVYGSEYTNPKTGQKERDIQMYITEKGRQHFFRKWNIQQDAQLAINGELDLK